MATAEMKFTKGAPDDAAHTGGQATRYRDPRFPNLYLEVGARSKTWRFRKFWKGQNFTEALIMQRAVLCDRPSHHGDRKSERRQALHWRLVPCPTATDRLDVKPVAP